MASIRRTSAVVLRSLVFSLSLVAAPAMAAVSEVANAVVEVVCADEAGSKHPEKFVVDQPVTTEALAGLEELRLIVGYDPEVGPTNFRGRLVSTATRIGGTGSDVLGRVRSRQNTADGSTLGEAQVRGSLVPGDIVRWKIRLDGSRLGTRTRSGSSTTTGPWPPTSTAPRTAPGSMWVSRSPRARRSPSRATREARTGYRISTSS